ncbi:MAG: SDR family NAD(P)-dependent oxidoreductase [Acidobacteriota bacterium]
MASDPPRVAVVTGGSSGIGAATVERLIAEGFAVITGARRLDRLRSMAEAVGASAVQLDVVDPESVERFAAAVREQAPAGLALLVNNAGGALGLDSVEASRDDHWEWMYQANVLGTLRMTRALLPSLIASGAGHVVNIGSIAGFETYPGGAGYTAAKHAARALTRTLRLELLGRPVRVTEIAPGLVETEFSKVRFDGDSDRAAKVYDGMTPLTAEDVADCVAWVATRPPHVNIDEMVVRPLDQAAATLVHRRPTEGQE